MVRIAGGSDEVEPLIERLGGIVPRMDCESSYAGYFSGLQCPKHRVFQETRAKPFSLPVRRDRETSQQHDRDWMPCQAFLQALRRAFMFHLADNQRVVTGNLRVRQRHVRLGGAGLLVLESVADQEAVERFASAVEAFYGVFTPKLLNVEIH